MGQIGEPYKVVRLPKPEVAPAFVPPARKPGEAPVPMVPIREPVPVPVPVRREP